jgi:hypothetical protein
MNEKRNMKKRIRRGREMRGTLEVKEGRKEGRRQSTLPDLPSF